MRLTESWLAFQAEGPDETDVRLYWAAIAVLTRTALSGEQPPALLCLANDGQMNEWLKPLKEGKNITIEVSKQATKKMTVMLLERAATKPFGRIYLEILQLMRVLSVMMPYKAGSEPAISHYMNPPAVHKLELLWTALTYMGVGARPMEALPDTPRVSASAARTFATMVIDHAPRNYLKQGMREMKDEVGREGSQAMAYTEFIVLGPKSKLMQQQIGLTKTIGARSTESVRALYDKLTNTEKEIKEVEEVVEVERQDKKRKEEAKTEKTKETGPENNKREEKEHHLPKATTWSKSGDTRRRPYREGGAQPPRCKFGQRCRNSRCKFGH